MDITFAYQCPAVWVFFELEVGSKHYTLNVRSIFAMLPLHLRFEEYLKSFFACAGGAAAGPRAAVGHTLYPAIMYIDLVD